MEQIPFIAWCLEHLNYVTITLLMMIESSFIPFPSEVVIPPAAYLAATGGELNVYLVVFFGTLGALLGALVNYALALYLGRPIIYRLAKSRLGAFLLLDEGKVAKSESFFDRHGGVSTFFGRLVPGIRQLISIPAGLCRMGLGKFILFTTLGAGLWNAILAFLGYYFSHLVPREELDALVLQYSREIGVAISVTLLLALLIVSVRAARRSN